MTTIILDTSFLIACAEFKIDYLTEFDRIMTTQYTVSVPDIVLKELETIEKKGTSKQKQAVKLTKTILQKKNIKIIKTTETKTADQAILTIADKEKIIATIDAELKKKLKKKKIPIIVVRQKKYLTIMHT
ncbi:PIN domain-containing protein [Candidatus Woesearchaeota archaeon]|nr:PIN domain-containing protein [Candidatus Woesearchaeota archaeon]